jgi:hypothetical protein
MKENNAKKFGRSPSYGNKTKNHASGKGSPDKSGNHKRGPYKSAENGRKHKRSVGLPTWMDSKIKGKVFTGRTSMDWIVFRPTMIEEFIIQGVYYHVQPIAPALAAAAAAVGVPPGLPPAGGVAVVAAIDC